MRLERTYHPLRLCYIAVQIAALASQHSLEFMMSAAPHLIAADFTLAGNVFPFGPTAAGPFSCEQRVEAAAKAGWDFGSPVTAMAFGVKESLIADFKKVDSLKQAQKLGFDGPFWSVEWDFTLAEATKSATSGHSKQATGEA
jgi:hypothetical protein